MAGQSLVTPARNFQSQFDESRERMLDVDVVSHSAVNIPNRWLDWVKNGYPGSWRRASLTIRFAVTGSLVLMVGIMIIGSWVARQIEEGVTQNTAAATALYMESIIAPVSQELADAERFSAGSAKAIEQIFQNTALGKRVISYKFWNNDGLIIHAAEPSLIGQTFGTSDNLVRAWQGEVVADFDDLSDAEDATELAHGLPLLEIYSPIREAYSGRIIAVAEFYEVATGLERDLREARQKSWFIVGVVGLLMFAFLFGIVSGGSRTIGRQRLALEGRVRELARLLEQNSDLRQKVEQASGRSAAVNERNLRRLSAELHDGPTQMLALAALRLDSIDGAADESKRREAVEAIREALKSAMLEIRNFCRGMAAPELHDCSVTEVIEMAVEGHQKRTGTSVVFSSETDELEIDHPGLLCLFRFVQEGLSNAVRHGKGREQRVLASVQKDWLTVEISDQGPGFDQITARTSDSGLGLTGLRDRIESMGGAFDVTSSPGNGTILTMRLYLKDGGKA